LSQRLKAGGKMKRRLFDELIQVAFWLIGALFVVYATARLWLERKQVERMGRR
jgi:hypothetical protein